MLICVYDHVDCSKMRVGMSNRVSSVPICPGTRGGESGHTTPKAMLSFELSIDNVENIFLEIDRNICIYTSHHHRKGHSLHASHASRPANRPTSQPVSDTKASSQASKTWPPHLFPHHIYYCREEAASAAYHALLTSAYSEAVNRSPPNQSQGWSHSTRAAGGTLANYI
jgi:hypothetical protein